ncbi:MAG: hypothetical protein KDB61_00210, partial [Planctomycetes bacterium]|nr:hypothetical protein [Planctomycetota bacterium]
LHRAMRVPPREHMRMVGANGRPDHQKVMKARRQRVMKVLKRQGHLAAEELASIEAYSDDEFMAWMHKRLRPEPGEAGPPPPPGAGPHPGPPPHPGGGPRPDVFPPPGAGPHPGPMPPPGAGPPPGREGRPRGPRGERRGSGLRGFRPGDRGQAPIPPEKKPD